MEKISHKKVHVLQNASFIILKEDMEMVACSFLEITVTYFAKF